MWGTRFPWTFPVRLDVWIPLMRDAPKTTAVAPAKVVGRIQRSAYYVELTSAEYGKLVDDLRAVPSVATR